MRRTKFLCEIPAGSLFRLAPFRPAKIPCGSVCVNTMVAYTGANLVSTCAQMCVLSRHSREKTPWRNNRVVCNARRGIVRGCKRRTWVGKRRKARCKRERRRRKRKKEVKESVFLAGAKCASPLFRPSESSWRFPLLFAFAITCIYYFISVERGSYERPKVWTEGRGREAQVLIF